MPVVVSYVDDRVSQEGRPYKKFSIAVGEAPKPAGGGESSTDDDIPFYWLPQRRTPRWSRRSGFCGRLDVRRPRPISHRLGHSPDGSRRCWTARSTSSARCTATRFGDRAAMSYERLEREAEKPKRIVDHRRSSTSSRRSPSPTASRRPDRQLLRVEADHARRARGARRSRVHVEPNGGGVALAWGYAPATARDRHRDQVPAARRQARRYARDPVDVPAAARGRQARLARLVRRRRRDRRRRLFDLVGDVAAVLVLPAGARTVQARVGGASSRAAPRVHLCHDADEDGDAGADEGGRGSSAGAPSACGHRSRAATGATGRAAATSSSSSSRPRATRPRYEFAPLDDFLAHAFPNAEPLLGEPGGDLPRPRLVCSWSTAPTAPARARWTIDAIAHLAAGVDWLGVPVPRPVRVCVIENEGPPALFQQKLAAKPASWDGPDFGGQRVRLRGPVGRVQLRRPRRPRRRSPTFCDEHAIDLVDRQPDARPRRRRLRPARRDAAVRRLARRVRPQDDARVLAPAPREQSRPDLRRLGPPPRHEGAAAAGRQPAAHEARLGEDPLGDAAERDDRRRRACSSGSSRRRATPSPSSTRVGASDAELEAADRRLPRRAPVLVDDDASRRT